MGASSSAGTELRRDHLVSFYERESFLIDSVLEFLQPALADDGTVALIATREHHEVFRAALPGRGVDVARAEARGQLVLLDAQRTREALSPQGTLEPARFRSLANGLLERLEGRGRPVRIFGYVTAMLWQDGFRDTALDLEQLWDEFATRRGFELMCSFPMSAFDGPEGVADFRRVCACHSAITNEGYAGLAPGPFDRDRVVVLHRELR